MFDFTEIPLGLHRPGTFVEIDESLAFQGLPVFSQRMVGMAQMITAGADQGTAAPLTLKRITRNEELDTLFGPGSMAARTGRSIRLNNPHHELYMMGVADDGAATPATRPVTFTAAPTLTSTADFRIGGQRVRFKAGSSDTVSVLASSFEAAVNENKQLPVTASAALGVVTLTARNVGIEGSQIDVRAGYFMDSDLPAGMGVTIGAVVAGTGNPDLAAAAAALDSLETYQTFVAPYTDASNLLLLEQELEDRFTALRAVDGANFTAITDTHGASSTLVESRDTPFTNICVPDLAPTPPWEIAGAYAGITTFSSAVDPGRPFQTLELEGVLPPQEGLDRFDDNERELLLQKGGATLRITASGRVQIERAVTTYKTSPSGAVDPSFQDLNTLRLMSYYRRSVVNWWGRKFPRHKLADDNQPINGGQSIMTPAGARAEQIAHYELMVEAGLMQDLQGYKDDLDTQLNTSVPGRLDIFERPRPIGQLRQTAVRAAFRL